MNPRRLGVFALALASGWGPCFAQALSDPMRPPGFAAPAGAAADEQASGEGLVLQSTLLSHGRRIAMIDGRSVKAGDRIGRARVISIEPGAVTLREANKTRVLKLYPGVEISGAGTAKAAASRGNAKEGAK